MLSMRKEPHSLPLVMDIQYQIDLILSLVFPNKLASIMSPKEKEELKTQVDDMFDKGLVRESKSSYMVLTVLVHENMDFGEYVLFTKLLTTF